MHSDARVGRVGDDPRFGSQPLRRTPSWTCLPEDARDFTLDEIRRLCVALPPPGRVTYGRTAPEVVRLAASVVPVVEQDGVAAVALTERASSMPSHAGHWVFPGGGVDPQRDGSLQATAVRELAEELGPDPEAVHLLGELSTHGPIDTGHVLHVFVAELDPSASLRPDAREVTRIAVLPLAELMREGVYFEDDRFPPGFDPPHGTASRSPSAQPFFRFGPDGPYLWGMQGEILFELLEFLARGRAGAGGLVDGG